MDAREVRELLDDRPDLESALEDVRAVDRKNETWGFDDIPVDSGAFGELVGSDIIESVDDEYRIAEPEVVDRLLSGETVVEDESEEFTVSVPEIDRVATGGLFTAVLLAIVLRSLHYGSVFREHVVFLANDPYSYAYYVNRAIESGWSVTDIPGPLQTGEPLTFVIMAVSAETIGAVVGVDVVLAWLPVIVGAVTVGLTYLLALTITDDRRIALAAAFCLAVTPAHAARTSLGFADHHAFDYIWLPITAIGLITLIDREEMAFDKSAGLGITALAIGVAGQVLSWEAGVLLLLPLAVAVTATGIIAVRDDDSFVRTGFALTVGVAVGSLIILMTHLVLGWHELLTVLVPVGVTAGVAGVTGASEAWRRLGLPAWGLATAAIVGTAVTTIGVRTLAPGTWATISTQISRLLGTEGITEALSLFGATYGWLLHFGFLLLFALLYAAWATSEAFRGNHPWAIAVSYFWTLLALAALQARFAGEFAAFAAVFAGVAVVHLAGVVDALADVTPFDEKIRQKLSLPDGRTVGVVAVLFLLVGGLALVQGPLLIQGLTIDEDRYQAASFVDSHAAETGHEYPDNYVLSPWSWNRMYNYIVSGEAASYGYADQTYLPFLASTNPDQAAEIQQRDDIYIVIEPANDPPVGSMYNRLHERYGSRGNGVAGLGTYRALYDRNGNVIVRVVDGAIIEGTAAPNSTVTLTTDVTIEGASFTYERQVSTNADGAYNVTVSYPGEYDIDGERVTVSEAAVNNGETVSA
jgi:asparagine N-glycosylation enzyme membrane subunit Stt3